MKEWIWWCDSGHSGTVNHPLEKCQICGKEVLLISAKCLSGAHDECPDPTICICPCPSTDDEPVYEPVNEPDYEPTVIVCAAKYYQSLGEFLSLEVWASDKVRYQTDFIALYQAKERKIKFIGRVDRLADPMEFAASLGVRRMAKDSRNKKKAVVVTPDSIVRLRTAIPFGTKPFQGPRYITYSKLINATTTDDLWR